MGYNGVEARTPFSFLELASFLLVCYNRLISNNKRERNSMLLSNIELKPEKILIQPTQEASSSFSTETKKYDRKAVGVIQGIPKNGRLSGYDYKVGDKVIFDDSDSIDFTIDGVALSIVDEYDIVAKIKGDE